MILALNKIFKGINRPVHIAPLVIFRIAFGAVMFFSILRFFYNGWIPELYIKPKLYFTYYAFEWVKPLGEIGMYALFALVALSALAIMVGWLYRISSVLFFLSFTYVELIDKTNYLNHYYFISIVALVLIFLPANKYFSIDVWKNPTEERTHVPFWTIGVLQLQLAILYFYAGVAKLNYDWLIRAMPLRIWLPANSHLPFIGKFLEYTWIAYVFSWFGAIYDLTIPFLLSFKRTRLFAYFLVIVFHVMTYWMFQIGMFPFIMIMATLIFFSENFHLNLLKKIKSILTFDNKRNREATILEVEKVYTYSNKINTLFMCIFVAHFIFQILFPWRFVFYKDNLFWTEQGFRFSWRVMLMEKAGMAIFHLKDPVSGKVWDVDNREFLTPNQEKMMATQPDMMLQFAHFLKEKYSKEGFLNLEVSAESYVTLNGRRAQPFVDSTVDLAKEKDTFLPKKWILPFKED